MKILCLFVRHGSAKYPDALAVLDQWYERHGLLGQRTLWILDNALDPATPPQNLTARTILRPGDNRSWEFSSWEQAMNQAAVGDEVFEIVHFVTSAFNTLYTEYLNHFRPDMLDYTLARHAALGHIDYYPYPVQLGGTLSQVWLRTCFFFLPWTVAKTRSPWISYHDPLTVFIRTDTKDFRPDAPLDAKLQAFIRDWLDGQEIGGHRWHSPVSNGPEEVIRFQRKTLAILNEHTYSVKLLKDRIRILDFCWLYHEGDAAQPVTVLPPDELDQVRARCRILGFNNPP